jgi:hypothetical protein
MQMKPKVSTPENTVTINYNKDELDKQKSFVMCPTFGCKEQLTGTWKDYETGEMVNGLKQYKCPGCGKTFTVNDFSTNCLPVPNEDGIGIVYDTVKNSILFKVNGSERFIDTDDVAYVYMPLKYITASNKFFYITNLNDLANDSEILELIQEKLHENK